VRINSLNAHAIDWTLVPPPSSALCPIPILIILVITTTLSVPLVGPPRHPGDTALRVLPSLRRFAPHGSFSIDSSNVGTITEAIRGPHPLSLQCSTIVERWHPLVKSIRVSWLSEANVAPTNNCGMLTATQSWDGSTHLYHPQHHSHSRSRSCQCRGVALYLRATHFVCQQVPTISSVSSTQSQSPFPVNCDIHQRIMFPHRSQQHGHCHLIQSSTMSWAPVRVYGDCNAVALHATIIVQFYLRSIPIIPSGLTNY
jgi:hypothetical protein